MNKSELFSTLKDINFAEKSADVITSEIISLYESMTERVLARGDPVRLFLETITLIIIQQRALIDYSAKMNLLAYAEGEYLDHLGALLGVRRLEASHAKVTIKFSLSKSQPAKILIPEGTRVSPGNNILFALNNAVEINAGALTCEAVCTCTEAGIIGNDFLPGQIKKLVDVFPYELTAENIDTSSGGTDIENDENFRERIQLAPESFSVAGPTGAYTYYARSANSDIEDCAVLGPHDNLGVPPGEVHIYPLMTGGNLPSQEILDEVYATCNAEDKRPDTDLVRVKMPQIVNYNLSVRFYIDSSNSSIAGQITNSVELAVNNFISWQRAKLGRDINPSELNRKIINAGAKRCEIESPAFRVLLPYQLAIVNQVVINYGGLEEG